MKKWTKFTALAILLIFSLLVAAGCGSQQKNQTAGKTLKVGVTAGPHAEVMDVVKNVAAKDGLNIEVVEFNDYVQPDVALNQGDIQANSMLST
jgi:D-methionine transport system substrate-binding protein